MFNAKDIHIRYLAFALAFFLTVASIGYGQDHTIAYPALLQEFVWTYGCTPTAAAMVLSYWDNYEPGVGKYAGYGKLIKYYYHANCSHQEVPNTIHALKDELSTDYNAADCSGSGMTLAWNIDDGIRHVTNDQNGYDFTSDNICETIWPTLVDWCWDSIKSAIDANIPFVWSQGNVSFSDTGHSVAAWGYTDDKFVIVYNTWGDGKQYWYYSDYCDEGGLDSAQVNIVVPGGGSDSDIALDQPLSDQDITGGGKYNIHWYQWGSQIATVSIDLTEGSDDTWTNIDTVPSPGAGWKLYEWQVPQVTIFGRSEMMRISAYDSAGNLIAADGTFGYFYISPPCSDLIVQSITTNPVQPTDNQDIDVTVTIMNQGSCPAFSQAHEPCIDCTFYKNLDSAPSPSDWGDIPPDFNIGNAFWGEVPAGGTVTWSGKIKYSLPGTYKIWAWIDWSQNVGETNESNNIFGPKLITVVPDTEAPSGSIAINGGARFTNSRSVTLNLTCNDTGSGCGWMSFYQEGAPECSAYPPWTRDEPFAPTRSWTLGWGYLYVRFFDRSGNSSQYKTHIFLDEDPPTGSVVINGGAARTKTESVTLTLSCTDTTGCSGIRLSNDNTTWSLLEFSSDEETITVTRPWTLSTGEGTRTVYAQYVDGAGNVSDIYSDTIEVVYNQPPVANCKSVTVPAGNTCLAPASIDNGSSDPDGDPITLTQLPSGPYPLGSTLVTLKVTDNSGASTTCQATVTVSDVTAPILTVPTAVTFNATSPSGVTLTDTMLGATARDNCSANVALTRVPSSNLFPIGVTRVTWTACDVAMNSSTATQTVAVLGASDQAAALANYLKSLGLDAGIKTPLVRLLDAANDSIGHKRTAAACRQFDAFRGVVNAQAGKAIPFAEAQQMIEAAIRISAVIGCRQVSESSL